MSGTRAVVAHDAGGAEILSSLVRRLAPEELFARPAHTFVGHFIGSPGMNVLPARIDGATARVEGGRVRWVQVRNVPSFAVALDRKIAVPEYGTVAADIAFGGQFYVQARAADMGVALGPEHAPAIQRSTAAGLVLVQA